MKDLRAGDQRGVDVEVGIVRGRPNEAHRSAFEMGEEDVLLGFIEAVNLVDEEDSGFIAQLLPSGRLLDFGPNLRHVGFDAIERLEPRTRAQRNDGGEGGFAGSGWSVENEGSESVRLDGPSQQLSFRQDVALPSHLAQCPGSHPGREGLFCQVREVGGWGFVVEEVGHLS